MASSSLVYNDTLIQERGEMLSLTDMWRASGGADGKRPARWRELPGTSEFVAHVASTIGLSDSECFQSVNESGTWNTWAHWQIGMAYAKYLSPKFHAWCNEVVRAYMESRANPQGPTLEEMLGEDVAEPAPKDDAVFAAELKRVFNEHLALGYTRERAAVIAELIVNPKAEDPHATRKAPRQHASKVVPFQGGEKLITNAELARRLGIPAADHAGAKRSIPYLLVAAGLLKSKDNPTLTAIGQKYGRRIRQEGNSGRRWVDPDTVKYLVEWRRKHNW